MLNGHKQLYNDNLRKLPNEYGDVSVMIDISVKKSKQKKKKKKKKVIKGSMFSPGLSLIMSVTGPDIRSFANR